MAKVATPQISWHGREPVLGVDVSQSGLIASAGNDNEVRLWKIKDPASDQPNIVFHQELCGHSKVCTGSCVSPRAV
jgi:WD40 repeat protein